MLSELLLKHSFVDHLVFKVPHVQYSATPFSNQINDWKFWNRAIKFVFYMLVRWVEFIGVLRHMQRYFSHVCDGTDV